MAWLHGAAAVSPGDASSVLRGPAAAAAGGLDGTHWRAAGAFTVPWGQEAVLNMDPSSLLPADHVLLRFTAAAGEPLAVIDLSLWYNRVLPAAALPVQAVPVAATVREPVQLPDAHPTAVTLDLGAGVPSLALVQVGVPQGDSLFHTATVAGRSAEVFDPNAVSAGDATTYLYFSANVAGWTFAQPRTLYLTAEYYDNPAGGHLGATYNSVGTGLPAAYASAGTPVTLGGSQRWTRATWRLPHAQFAGRQNFGADFRLAGTPGVTVSAITLSPSPPQP